MKENILIWVNIIVVCINEIQSENLYTENEVEHTKLPATSINNEIDIFKLANVSDKDQGVSLVEGPIRSFPAFKFRIAYSNIPLPNSKNVTQAMFNNTDDGLTVIFVYRQQKNNLGTLISVNSPGRIRPWFEVISNLKTNILSLKYKFNSGSKLRQIDWNLPNNQKRASTAAWIWLSVNINFTAGTVRLDLDCKPSRLDSLGMKGNRLAMNVPEESLVYFGQEPGRKKKFLGSMQVAKILPYVTSKRMWSCLHIFEKLAKQDRKPLH